MISYWWDRMRKFLASAGLLISYPSRENPLIWSQYRPKLQNIISDVSVLGFFLIWLFYYDGHDRLTKVTIVNFSPKNVSGQFVQNIRNPLFMIRSNLNIVVLWWGIWSRQNWHQLIFQKNPLQGQMSDLCPIWSQTATSCISWSVLL